MAAIYLMPAILSWIAYFILTAIIPWAWFETVALIGASVMTGVSILIFVMAEGGR